MSRKRVFIVSVVLASVVLAAIVSWIAGSSIKSPAEVAARTAPPEPSPILVSVEERTLSANIVTRGTARFGLPQPISLVQSLLKAKTGIITRLPRRNKQIREGAMMLVTSGRPVLVLRGTLPTYRDLVPGIAGDDVQQLEGGLKRLGFDPGPLDAVYDEHTSAAVARWYTSAGWQPFGPTAEHLARIRELELELASAQNERVAASNALDAAPRLVEAARANANRENKAADANVAEMTQAWNEVMLNRKSKRVEKSKVEADLKLAQAAATATRLAGELDIQAAVDAVGSGRRDVELAARKITQIETSLDNARSRAGIQIPADEIVFVPSLPVRIEKVELAMGDEAVGTVLTVTNNQLVVDSHLPFDEGRLVKPGMAVGIDEPTLGVKATGVVKRVADTPGTNGVDGYHVYLEVYVRRTSMVLEGFSLRLTIPIESTGGAVTAVPVSALSLTPDGTTRVQVQDNGVLKYVAVEPGLSADGFVQVTPVDGVLTPGQFVVIGYEE